MQTEQSFIVFRSIRLTIFDILEDSNGGDMLRPTKLDQLELVVLGVQFSSSSSPPPLSWYSSIYEKIQEEGKI